MEQHYEPVETVRYVINGANQIACIDTDGSGTCNGSETLWTYDPYGNLLSDGTTTYTYDKANRVSSIIAAGVTTTYTYDGDGDRISQTVGTVTTTYILDTATPLTMVLSETTGGVTTRYWHGLDTLAQSDGTTTQYFAYDGLGSVRQLVDASGSVGLAQTFDPYGNGYAKAGSTTSSFGYSGEQTDSNGFIYLRARYYSPSMGRFTQMDPSRLERNPYLYGMSNPVLNTDPSGLCSANNCGGESSLTAAPMSIYLNMAFTTELFMALFGSCAAQKDISDFVDGIFDQLYLDLIIQPYNGAVNLIAHIQAPPYIGSRDFPFHKIENLAIGTNIIADQLNSEFWSGSGWYKTGRLVGRSISWGFAFVLLGSGYITTSVGATGGAASLICEFVSAGACSFIAAGGGISSAAFVVVGVSEMVLGGAIVLANATSPVGGVGGGKLFKKKCSTAHKVLTNYRRLLNDYGKKVSENKLKQLDALKDAGTIKATDLPAGMVRGAGFPGEWMNKPRSEIEDICGKNWKS